MLRSNHPFHATADEVVGRFGEAGQEAFEVQKLACLLKKMHAQTMGTN